jgi:hypothetical protein
MRRPLPGYYLFTDFCCSGRMLPKPGIQVICSACGDSRKVPHGRVKAGLTLVCETCGHPTTFDSQSEDINARQALHAARRYRRSLISAA